MTKDDKKLNDNEIKVLETLLENARMSYTEISKKTGLTRQTVVKIISKFEKNKTIWGYTSILDFKILGKKIFIALIKTKSMGNFDKIMEGIISSQKLYSEIRKIKVVTSGFYHGDYDVVVIFAAENVIQVKKFVNFWKNSYPDLVDEIKVIEQVINLRTGGFLNPYLEREVKELV